MADSHAIVFGAAGLLGWATLNQLLAGYPSFKPFSRVTAVLNRPVSEPDLHLPAGPNRPPLEIVSEINLLQGSSDELATQLREKVINVETITHVFYFGIAFPVSTKLYKKPGFSNTLFQSSHHSTTTTSKNATRTAPSCSASPTQ